MERYETIGEGRRASHPYEVALHWDSSPQSVPLTIVLSEGRAHSAMGGCFPLSAMLQDTWTDHLEICGCLWLREAAREEQARGRFFSADELYALWKAR